MAPNSGVGATARQKFGGQIALSAIVAPNFGVGGGSGVPEEALVDDDALGRRIAGMTKPPSSYTAPLLASHTE